MDPPPKGLETWSSHVEFPPPTLQIKWWDYAFKFLKAEESATQEEHMVICKFQAERFLNDDSFRTLANGGVTFCW